jgi:phosphatidylglycerol:prolipoprotein diacylglycerol transferase
VVAGYFVCKAAAAKEGLPANVFAHIFFWALVFGFLGARVTYILVEWKWFLANPLGVIFSRSGFVFYGGVIAGILTVLILAKKYKLDLLKSADVAALGIPLGHAIGRIGCFCYGCCYGVPTNSFPGVLFPPQSPAGLSGVKVIPTQLISAFSLFLIFCLLLMVRKRRRFSGQVVLSYTFFYGIFRFIIEFYRGDWRGKIFFLSTSQFFSLIAIIASVIFFLKWRRGQA